MRRSDAYVMQYQRMMIMMVGYDQKSSILEAVRWKLQ